jgi:hypothetical protein
MRFVEFFFHNQFEAQGMSWLNEDKEQIN